MKNVMAEVVKKVVYDRWSLADKNRTIQLSLFFMNKYLDEFERFSGTKITRDNEFGMEIELETFGVTWLIRSRPYRDDTNDADVEEAIYELLTSKE